MYSSEAKPEHDPIVRITVETVIDDQHSEVFYALYLAAFGPLRTRAAARQVLHRSEFFEDMTNPLVWKYVAWDDQTPVALATMTKSLDTVPWISPEYFRNRFPEHAARDAIYYLGFTLVHPSNRYPSVLDAMFDLGMQRLLDEQALCAYDLCQYNVDRGFAHRIERLLGRQPGIRAVAIDTQTYYQARFG